MPTLVHTMSVVTAVHYVTACTWAEYMGLSDKEFSCQVMRSKFKQDSRTFNLSKLSGSQAGER